MKRIKCMFIAVPLLAVLFISIANAEDEPTVAQVTHTEFQAVDETGEQIYADTDKVILEGILLHNPADMLNPNADESITDLYNVSAQWQIFFQGDGDDHAGTAVWMGQRYDNLPWVMTGGYSDTEFIAEMKRINFAQFSPGDKIRVTGHFLSYHGKNNVNEQHNIDPAKNFTIEMVEQGVGLPHPELVTLDELKDGADNFIFDQSRLIGCEYYQARLIKIEDVNFVDYDLAQANWKPDGEFEITDGTKTFPVKLGRGNGIYTGSNNLSEPFDIIGIVDQESSNLTSGYRLYVMNYDGNGFVLAEREHRRADKPGDLNLNGIVDNDDVYELLEDYVSNPNEN